jgi:tight adherence protein C
MRNTILLISIFSFAGTILVFAGIFYHARNRERRKIIVEKIKGNDPSALGNALELGNKKGLKNELLNYVKTLGNSLRPKEGADLSTMRKKLLQAGFRRVDSALIFFGFKAVFAIVFFFSVFAGKLFFLNALSSSRVVAFSVLFALGGLYLPNIWLHMKILQRRREITEGFPDALDLMVVCVESGMGLDAALSRVGEEMRLENQALHEEFKLLNLELRAGKSRSDALRNLAVRTGLDDVSSLITLLIQTDRFGTSIAQALRVHSDAMRDKRRQRAEEIAAKLPVKLVFPLVLFIFPSIFVVLVGPAAIKIIRNLFPVMGG